MELWCLLTTVIPFVVEGAGQTEQVSLLRDNCSLLQQLPHKVDKGPVHLLSASGSSMINMLGLHSLNSLCRNSSWHVIVNKHDAKACNSVKCFQSRTKITAISTGLPLLCQEAKEKFSITSDDWQSQSCQEPWASQNGLSHAEPC